MTPQERLVLVSAPQAAATPASPQAQSRDSGVIKPVAIRAFTCCGIADRCGLTADVSGGCRGVSTPPKRVI